MKRFCKTESGRSIFILNTSALMWFIILIGCLGGCDDKDDTTHLTNDTTAILRLAIDSAFADDNIHDLDRLKRKDDTVIFLYDRLYTRCMPLKVRGSIFKFLTRKQIYSLAIHRYNDAADPLFFLMLSDFRKQDSVYTVSLQNYCVLPLFDAHRQLRKLGKVYVQGTMLSLDENHTIINKDSCIVGLRCGGGMTMNFLKQGDSLKAKVDWRWSN